MTTVLAISRRKLSFCSSSLITACKQRNAHIEIIPSMIQQYYYILTPTMIIYVFIKCHKYCFQSLTLHIFDPFVDGIFKGDSHKFVEMKRWASSLFVRINIIMCLNFKSSTWITCVINNKSK